MDASGGVFEAFVPRIAQRLFLADGEAPTRPRAEAILAAVLLADVSGFTPLVERLSQQGERGPEEVQRVVNLCFGRLTAAVEEAGGDVLKFAGDAALALWPADDEQELCSAVLRAAQCGLRIQQLLDRADLGDRQQLRLRVALGAGQVQVASVGGVEGRWEVLVTGPPFEQIATALRQTTPGHVTLSPDAAGLVREGTHGSQLAAGCFQLEALTAPVVVTDFRPLPRCGEAALRAYVPRAVQARLDAGQHEWLGEFRRVSVLFANLGASGEAGDDVAQLQRSVEAVQVAVYRYGGSINQLVADEKGTTLVAAWGVAQHAYEDDPVRAVRAALAMHESLHALGVAGRVGLATERIFAGTRGSAHRMEFGLMGDGVNLAARLMQAAQPILCDAATRSAARNRIVFESLAPLTVKGKSAPVEAYRPRAAKPAVPERAAPVGRSAELRLLEERLLALERNGRGGVVLIEGEPGIGKSRLLRHLVERAQTAAVRTLIGSGDAIERSTAYHAWRPVLASLLGPDAQGGTAALAERLRALAGEDVAESSYLPLLNPLLPVPLAESTTTREMTPRSRADGVRDLLVRILRTAAARAPVLLILEDAHWLDSASWELAEAVAQRLPSLLLVIGTRPLGTKEQAGERLLALPGALHLRLDVLAPEESLALVCQRLDVDVVPEALARFIRERAEGHPLFIEELTYALRDGGFVRVEGGECRIATASGALESIAMPVTVQGVVTSRIDALTPQEQLTLKVASVIGQRFEVRTLRDIHPIAADRGGLGGQLATMERLQLLQLLRLLQLLQFAPEVEPGYAFKHAVIQGIAYGLLPYAQRQPLHRAVATWYEREQPGDVPLLYPLLAHHWREAGERAKAIDYLEKAGEHALMSTYANREAERFFSQLLALAKETGVPERAPAAGGADANADAHRRRWARWERHYGEAVANQGRLDEGSRLMGDSLARLGDPLPRTPRRLQMRLAARLCRQMLHRFVPRLARPYGAGAARHQIEVVRAYARLGAYSYGLDRYPPALYALISGLNLAERIGPTPELALAYADSGNAVGMVPLHRLARTYGRMALETAERVDDPSTTAIALARTSIYRTVTGDWEASKALERSREISERLGNNAQWEESTYVLLRLHYFRGELERAAALSTQLYARACDSGALVHQIWASEAHAECLLRLGALDDAIERAQAMLALIQERQAAAHTALGAWGVLASAWRRKGDLAQAAQAAVAAAQTMEQASGATFNFDGFIGMAEASVAMIEAGRSDAARLALAQRACRTLRWYATRVTITEPAARLWQGCFDWARGRHGRARQSWLASLAAAERMSLPYDAALARREIGRRLPAGDAERRGHLEQAAVLFTQLGAVWDAAHARALAEEP